MHPISHHSGPSGCLSVMPSDHVDPEAPFPPLLGPSRIGVMCDIDLTSGLAKQGVRKLDATLYWNWLIPALADFNFHSVSWPMSCW